MPESAAKLLERPLSLRRSKLVMKGGNWDAIRAVHGSDADVIHLELEAGFDESIRDQVVATTLRALRELEWTHKEAWVRFRHIDNPATLSELERILQGQPQLVYCAKTRCSADIVKLDEAVTQIERKLGLPVGRTQIGTVIENVEALADVDAICSASPRMGAIMFGANDMSLSFGYRRMGAPADAPETYYIRSRMVHAARLAKIHVFDAAHMGRSDLEGGERDADFSARFGFTGKTALNADQIPGIHRAFIPTDSEILWADAILKAEQAAMGGPVIFEGDVLGDAELEWAKTLKKRYNYSDRKHRLAVQVKVIDKK